MPEACNCDPISGETIEPPAICEPLPTDWLTPYETALNQLYQSALCTDSSYTAPTGGCSETSPIAELVAIQEAITTIIPYFFCMSLETSCVSSSSSDSSGSGSSSVSDCCSLEELLPGGWLTPEQLNDVCVGTPGASCTKYDMLQQILDVIDELRAAGPCCMFASSSDCGCGLAPAGGWIGGECIYSPPGATTVYDCLLNTVDESVTCHLCEIRVNADNPDIRAIIDDYYAWLQTPAGGSWLPGSVAGCDVACPERFIFDLAVQCNPSTGEGPCGTHGEFSEHWMGYDHYECSCADFSGAIVNSFVETVCDLYAVVADGEPWPINVLITVELVTGKTVHDSDGNDQPVILKVFNWACTSPFCHCCTTPPETPTDWTVPPWTPGQVSSNIPQGNRCCPVGTFPVLTFGTIGAGVSANCYGLATIKLEART